MQRVLLTYKNGEKKAFSVSELPISEEELNRRLETYYRGKNCDRCRRAVTESGFYRLIMEIDDGDPLSEGTLALFPVLKDCTDISVTDK